ncbi:MAG: hypothetical protein JWQ04_839 [Pedosphaera sp.]|nr:hypothetical protein [Pedosphaera sp.]
MFRPLQTCLFAATALALIILGQRIGAQPGPFPEARPGKLPLSAVVTNGNVTFSWPVLPGKWELSEQQPPLTGEWKPVPAESYHTNAITVSATVPQPNQTTLYRVKRSFAFRPPNFPDLPPVPPPPTNRVPPKLPARP